MTDCTPSRTAQGNADRGWSFPDWELAWEVFDRNDMAESKRKLFKTEEAMLKFRDQVEDKPNFKRVVATGYPRP